MTYHPSHLPIGAMLAMALFAAGFAAGRGSVPATPSPSDMADGTSGPLAAIAVSIDRSREVDGGICRYVASYPSLGMEDTIAARRAQDEVLSLFGDASSTTPGEARIDEAAASFLETCAIDLAKVRREFPDAASADEWYEQTVADMHLNDGRLLSVEVAHETYAGGAHPNQWSDFLLIDTATGRRLRLGDVIRPDRLQELDRLEKRIVLDAAKDMLFDEVREAYETAVALTASLPVEAQVAQHGLRDDFYVDIGRKALVFVHDPYDIAPYAAGDIEAVIPFADLRDIVDPAGPMGYLAK